MELLGRGINLNKLQNNQQIVIAKRKLPCRIFLSRIIDMEFSVHKSIELLYVIKGAVKIQVRDDTQILNEGDFYIIGSNKAHSIYCEKDNILLSFQIDSGYLENNFGIPEEAIFLNDINDTTIKQSLVYALGSLYIENLKNQSNYNIYINKLRKLINAMKPYLLDDTTQSDYIDRKDTVEAVVYNIVEKYSDITSDSEDITLERMAIEYNVSYAYLSRMFKKITGVNFTRYFLKQKLNKAVDLLLNTNKTITDISVSSGFPDVKSLNRDFRKMFGMSPTDFRYKYNDINERIKESILYNDYSVQKFIRMIRKENYKNYGNTFIENKNYNLALNANVSNMKSVWNKIINLNSVIDNNISNLDDILRGSKFKSMEIKFAFAEDRFLLATERGLRELSKIEISKLVGKLNDNNINPIVQLDFISNNKKMFYKDSNIFHNKCYSKIKSALDFVSMIMGISRLAKWKFELYIPEISKLIINIDTSKILFKHVKYFVDVLEDKFGKNGYIWGIYIGRLEIKEENENIKYIGKLIKELKKLSQQPEFYRLDLFYYHDGSICEANFPSLVDSLNSSVNMIKKHLKLYKTNKKQKLISTLNYVVNNMELFKKHNILYYNLFLNLVLLNIEHDRFYISSCKVIDCDFKSKVDSIFYNKYGIKLLSYYISRFIEELKSDVICMEDGCFATKDGKDVVILLYADYKECYKCMENPFNIKNRQVEKEIMLNIDGLQGRYKITEYQIDYNNSFFYKKFIKNTVIESMTEEEKAYIQSRTMPKMKVNFLKADGLLKYFTKLNFLGISLIKLQRV